MKIYVWLQVGALANTLDWKFVCMRHEIAKMMLYEGRPVGGMKER